MSGGASLVEVGGLAWWLGVAGSAWEGLGGAGSGWEWPGWLCEAQRGGGTYTAWK